MFFMEVRTKIAVILTTFALCVGLNGLAFAAESMTIPMKNMKGEEVGEVKLTQTPNSLLIQAMLTKLPPGEHAFHIHAVGKCEPPFASAGPHFSAARL